MATATLSRGSFLRCAAEPLLSMVLSSNLSAMKRSGSAASAQIADAYAEEKAASIDAEVDAM